MDDFYEEDESPEAIQAAWNQGREARLARHLPLRFRWWALRSRVRLMRRAISGKPMVIVRGSMIVDSADIHGGLVVEKDAHATITNCHFRDYTGNALEIKH